MKRLFREPLFHFLLLGALIFGVNAWKDGPRPSEEETGPSIEVTAGTVAWLREGFGKQWHREPDEDELRGLVDDHIREEVLYREALALGLDRNDTIVRRRMAQKMEFLGQDIVSALEADDEALRAYFKENAARYARPPGLSFRHVYFSRERSGEGLDSAAREALAALKGGADEEATGDPFLGEYVFTAADETEIAAALGGAFAAEALKLPAGEWSGPLESSYGVHLVHVTERTEGEALAFEDVRDAVERDFSEERRRVANADFIRRMTERYRISVDEAALKASPAEPDKTAMR